MSIRDSRIAVIGAGNMGDALIGGLVESGLIPAGNIATSDVAAETLDSAARRWKVETTRDNRAAVRGRDIVLLAIKPQVASPILGEIAPALAPDA